MNFYFNLFEQENIRSSLSSSKMLHLTINEGFTFNSSNIFLILLIDGQILI